MEEPTSMVCSIPVVYLLSIQQIDEPCKSCGRSIGSHHPCTYPEYVEIQKIILEMKKIEREIELKKAERDIEVKKAEVEILRLQSMSVNNRSSASTSPMPVTAAEHTDLFNRMMDAFKYPIQRIEAVPDGRILDITTAANEADLNLKVGDKLREFLNSDLFTVYNAEPLWLQEKWKPDLHLSSPLIVHSANSRTGAFVGGTAVRRPHGSCAKYVRAIMEGTFGDSDLSANEIGVLFEYLVALSEENHLNPVGIVYNLKEFVYARLSSENDSVIVYEIARCDWKTPGSVDYLVEKLQSDESNQLISRYFEGIDDYMKQYGLEPERTMRNDDCCVLGHGATSLVFQVNRKDDGKVMALRTTLCDVTCTYDSMVESEFSCLASLWSDNAKAHNVLVLPEQDSYQCVSLLDGSYNLHCYLLTEVGAIEKPDTKDICKRLFTCLHQYHTIMGMTHGDARWPNIVRLGPYNFKMIDAYDPQTLTPENRIDDFLSLACSINQNLPRATISAIRTSMSAWELNYFDVRVFSNVEKQSRK